MHERERQIETEGKAKERTRESKSAKKETGEKRRGRDVLISFSVIRSGETALPNSTSAKQIYPRY